MSEICNAYHQEDNDPYNEMVQFFGELPYRGRLCYLGEKSKEYSISLSNMGYEVTVIDQSNVEFDIDSFDFVLVNGIIQLLQEPKKDISVIQKVCRQMKQNAIYANCMTKSEKAEDALKKAIADTGIHSSVLLETYLEYPESEEKLHFYVLKKKSHLLTNK